MKRHKVRTFLRAVAGLAVAVTWASLAQAQCGVEWTGKAGDGQWSNPDNWNTHEVPGPASDVCIKSGSADARAIPSVSVNSIQVSQGAGVVFGTGTVSIATPVTMEGGLSLLGTTLSVTSVDVPSGGSLNGNGTIQGSLTMGGVILPEATPITVTGDYTQTSTGEVIEYWGSGGILNVNGNATLSGYLYVQYSTRVPPKSGSTFTAMTYGSHSGEFSNLSPGTAKYTNNSVVVKFP